MIELLKILARSMAMLFVLTIMLVIFIYYCFVIIGFVLLGWILFTGGFIYG